MLVSCSIVYILKKKFFSPHLSILNKNRFNYYEIFRGKNQKLEKPKYKLNRNYK